MAAISVYVLLIFFEFSKVCSNAFSTYCTLPCPFMCPAQPSGSYGAIQLPSRSCSTGRCSFFDNSCNESDDTEEEQKPEPLPDVKTRRQPFKPSPSPTPKKPKPKPPPEDSKTPPEDSKRTPDDDPEPPPRKRDKPSSNTPSIQPSRRFFTSLFSIPGAVVDTLVSGEIVL